MEFCEYAVKFFDKIVELLCKHALGNLREVQTFRSEDLRQWNITNCMHSSLSTESDIMHDVMCALSRKSETGREMN